jgi:hypothetical protein
MLKFIKIKKFLGGKVYNNHSTWRTGLESTSTSKSLNFFVRQLRPKNYMKKPVVDNIGHRLAL